MKNFKKLWAVALMLAASFAMVSCDEDEPTIDVGEGLNVADGIYIAKEGEDPVATAQLFSEQVEADGFGAQEREGFVASYVFLEAGNYNIVETVDREVASTWGGTLADSTTYKVAIVSEDGAAFNISSNGLYKITYDEMTSEVLVFKIDVVGLIGDATPGGGGTDTELSGSVNAQGGSWSVDNVIMRAGWYKIRFNSNWNINRKIDPAGDLSASNGYLAFTNLGGTSPESLSDGNVDGNLNIVGPDEEGPKDGVYSFEVTWDPTNGFALSQERTGDAPAPDPFEPDDNRWAVVGAATSLGWPSNNDCGAADQDVDMTYDGVVDGAHTWTITIDLAADEFKFRKNDCWDGDKGVGGFESIEGPDADKIGGDNNFACLEAGTYLITLKTADSGDTYTVAFDLQ